MAMTKGDRVLHVHPRGDLIEHEMTERCVCGPETRPVPRGDGSYGWLIVHASLDGREAHVREEAKHGD